MSEAIELNPVDRLGAGAVGEPGRRAFLIQAEAGSLQISVLVEKQQVAALARHALALLEQLDRRLPNDPGSDVPAAAAALQEPMEPLFRARQIRLGYDVGRGLIVLELQEFNDPEPDDESDESDADAGPDDTSDASDADVDEQGRPRVSGAHPSFGAEPRGRMVRVLASRAQMRALAQQGARVVAAGRPMCELCRLPMGPERQGCPQQNWQGCPGMN